MRGPIAKTSCDEVVIETEEAARQDDRIACASESEDPGLRGVPLIAASTDGAVHCVVLTAHLCDGWLPKPCNGIWHEWI